MRRAPPTLHPPTPPARTRVCHPRVGLHNKRGGGGLGQAVALAVGWVEVGGWLGSAEKVGAARQRASTPLITPARPPGPCSAPAAPLHLQQRRHADVAKVLHVRGQRRAAADEEPHSARWWWWWGGGARRCRAPAATSGQVRSGWMAPCAPARHPAPAPGPARAHLPPSACLTFPNTALSTTAPATLQGADGTEGGARRALAE